MPISGLESARGSGGCTKKDAASERWSRRRTFQSGVPGTSRDKDHGCFVEVELEAPRYPCLTAGPGALRGFRPGTHGRGTRPELPVDFVVGPRAAGFQRRRGTGSWRVPEPSRDQKLERFVVADREVPLYPRLAQGFSVVFP